MKANLSYTRTERIYIGDKKARKWKIALISRVLSSFLNYALICIDPDKVVDYISNKYYLCNMKTTVFKFRSFGENLGARGLGEKVRQDLIATIESSECVILDFEGVNVVSNSFADECIAKLIPILGFNKLKQKTTFRNINDFARKNVLIALRRRLSLICSE